ncbi:UNVERIFIED_CONTAM: hypothetical protein Sangu_0826800 [Sesamum angustifolium]|uniref:Uncharacterized protein n=1 Tax=Sesamum angustifolium TaxID=2727405 RepID=A0AAW2PWC2_9LAMI
MEGFNTSSDNFLKGWSSHVGGPPKDGALHMFKAQFQGPQNASIGIECVGLGGNVM